jgi:hypothetical protein
MDRPNTMAKMAAEARSIGEAALLQQIEGLLTLGTGQGELVPEHPAVRGVEAGQTD